VTFLFFFVHHKERKIFHHRVNMLSRNLPVGGFSNFFNSALIFSNFSVLRADIFEFSNLVPTKRGVGTNRLHMSFVIFIVQ